MEGKTENCLEDNMGEFMISTLKRFLKMKKAQSIKEKIEITLKLSTSAEQKTIKKCTKTSYTLGRHIRLLKLYFKNSYKCVKRKRIQ